MKIEDHSSTPADLRSTSVGRPEESRTGGRVVDHRQGSGDTASLSALSTELSRALQKEPPELVAKISRLQEAVASGTYSVPAEKVSSRIVSAAIGADF